MDRRVPLVAATVLLLATVVVAGVVAWRGSGGTAYQAAVSAMPASTLRASYTDWSDVRRLADAGDLSSERQAEDFLTRAYDRDLTSASVLVDAAPAMSRHFGLSPFDADWEMVGQGREGAVALLKVPSSVDLDAFEQRLATLGYDEPPGGPGSGEVWSGGPDLVAQIDSALTPVVQHVVVLPDERTVVFSDAGGFATSSAQVVTGDAPSLADEVEGTEALADLAEEPVSAVFLARDFACEELSMAQADAEDVAAADRLIERAGDVNPLAGYVLARQEDSVLVAMHFETEEQARQDVRARLRLAQGPAVGQGGSFADRFSVEQARQDGTEVVLDLRPAGPDEAVLGDLGQGPVLFAAC